MSRQELPHERGPFEAHVANVECVQNPASLIAVKAEVVLRSGYPCVADVAAVQIGENVQTAHYGMELVVIKEDLGSS